MMENKSIEDLRNLRVRLNLFLYEKLSPRELEVDMYKHAVILLNNTPKTQGKRNDINGEKGERHDIIGKIVGISGKNLSRFEKVKELQQKYPDTDFFKQFLKGGGYE